MFTNKLTTLTEPKGNPQKKRVTLALLSELPPLPLTGKRGHLLSENKLASLEATLVRNSADLLTYLLTGVKCRATSVAKKMNNESDSLRRGC